MKRRVYSAFHPTPSAFGGAGNVNAVAFETLRNHFQIVESPDEADIQFGTTLHDLPSPPRRFLLDHGAFADASFWAFAAPRLAPSDTIAVTSRVCQAIAARMWDSNGPALVDVPLFADTNVFHPSADRSSERQAFAREFDLDIGAPWLLCVGSYSGRKNTHLAVAFFAALRRFLPSARLILVLPAPDAPSRRATAAFIDRTIEDLGVGAAIRRLPALPSRELARVMSVADLLVHLTTCRIENFGLVIAEAMAAGLPVLASDWGGLRDLVVDEETGYLAATHLSARGPRVRFRASVHKVAALLQDEGRWSAASHAASERAAQRFALPTFRRALVSALERSLGRVAADGRAPLTGAAEDLKFATIWLQTKYPDVRDTSTLFRRLLDLEGGRFAELLLGPAATSESPPSAAPGKWAYPAVGYEVTSDRTIRVDEPAWEEEFAVAPEIARLAGRVLRDPSGDQGTRIDTSDVEAAAELSRLGVINLDPQ